MITIHFTFMIDKVNLKRQNNPKIGYYLLKNIDLLLSRFLK
jgi:hypothetical protein